MRIGFVTPFLTRSGGGIFASAQRLAQTLAMEDDVRVFGLDDVAAADDLPTWQPLLPESFRVRGPRAFGYAPGLGRAVRDARLEVVHSHGLWMYPTIAARRSGAPGIISPHGMLDPWALALSRWKKRIAGAFFQNAHLREASCLHALCQSEAESIRAYGLRNPICVIPNGVDLPSPSAEPPSWAERIPPHEKVLLYLGRLHPKKGLANLLRAWPSIGAPWHLAIAGWNQAGHEEDLQKLATELRTSRIHFLGAQFGVAKSAAYRRADAFVLPSLSEGLPMVVLEAWAHGKPVLMTTECNLPEGFAASAAIRIPTNSEGIGESLRKLATMSDSERCEMGLRGRRLVEQRFSWQNIACDFRAVYDWMLRGGTPPDCIKN